MSYYFFFLFFSVKLFSQSVVFDDARLIIGDGSVLENASILIQEGQIAALGPRDQINAGSATRISMSGKTIMPAMIDAHAHLGFQDRISWGAENYTLEPNGNPSTIRFQFRTPNFDQTRPKRASQPTNKQPTPSSAMGACPLEH